MRCVTAEDNVNAWVLTALLLHARLVSIPVTLLRRMVSHVMTNMYLCTQKGDFPMKTLTFERIRDIIKGHVHIKF